MSSDKGGQAVAGTEATKHVPWPKLGSFLLGDSTKVASIDFSMSMEQRTIAHHNSCKLLAHVI